MMPANRRDFIKNTSKATLGLVIANKLPNNFLQNTAGKPAGKIGVALLGLGGFSKDSIAPEIASSKNVWFAGVITGDPQGKGKEWSKQYGFPEKNIYHYSQIDQLSNNPDIDFVHVVTPTGLHAAHTIAVAKAGKHVLCEKPMAINSAECRQMIAACKKAGVLLGINYRLHWEPHHVKMMELINAKTYGNLKSIAAEFSWSRGDYKPWLLDKKLAGGGAFFDTGVYTIQAGCYLTNQQPIRVTALPSSTRDVYKPGMEETMSAIFEYPDGTVMTARSSYAYSNSQLMAAGNKGTITCEGSVFSQSARGKPSPKSLKLPGNQTFKADDTLQLAAIHDAFADAIINKTAFKTPGEMGLRDIEIIEAVYKSAKSNKVETILY